MSLVLQLFIEIFLMALAISGMHRLWMKIIQPGEIFGRVSIWIDLFLNKERETNNKFIWKMLHKSLGSCAMCNRQRFIELSMIGFWLMTIYHWYHYIFIFMLLVGMTVTIDTYLAHVIKRKTNNINLKTKTTTL